MRDNPRTSGFAAIEILFGVVILILIGVIAFYALKHPAAATLSPTPSPTPSVSGSMLQYDGPTNFTGVYGTVGSTGCPAQQANNPCPTKSAPGMEITAQSAIAQNTNGFKATSDSSGSYHLTLPPGSYSLTARSAGQTGFPSCGSSGPVAVTNGNATRYDFVCQNGIE